MSKLQDKIDAIVEDKQAKYYTKAHIDAKVRLEAANELLMLEVNNLQLKDTLRQWKEKASGIVQLNK